MVDESRCSQPVSRADGKQRQIFLNDTRLLVISQTFVAMRTGLGSSESQRTRREILEIIIPV